MALDLARMPTDEPRHPVIHDRWDPVHVFTVRDEHRVIGGVSVNPWRGIAGIYDMGVRPEHRRRGIGRALTLAACGLARDLGCTHAVLNATPEGELLYRTVGFERLGEGRTWWRHPGERTTPRQRELVEAIGFGDLEHLEALNPTRAELVAGIGGAGAALVITALTGSAKAAAWILERHPDLVSAPLSDAGETLLHATVEWDAPEVASVALARGADPEVRDREHNGTALGWAHHFGREWLAPLLS
jgi:GNAT superfamily N-acetyltransferase